MFRHIIIYSLLIASCIGCKKYESGPYFSIVTKKERIKNTWTPQQVTRQVSALEVVDITSNYADVTIELGQDTAIISFPIDGEIEQYYGNWELAENNTALTWDVKGDTTFQLLDTIERFDILRLTTNEFWLAYDVFGQYRVLKLGE